MGAGFTYRMGRIFGGADGRAVIVPVDHGLLFGAIEGLEDPCALLERLIAAGIDGTLLAPGIRRQTAHLLPSTTRAASLPAVGPPSAAAGAGSHRSSLMPAGSASSSAPILSRARTSRATRLSATSSPAHRSPSSCSAAPDWGVSPRCCSQRSEGCEPA